MKPADVDLIFSLCCISPGSSFCAKVLVEYKGLRNILIGQQHKKICLCVCVGGGVVIHFVFTYLLRVKFQS